MTDKQRRFAEEYLKDSNGTQAAIRAGYSPKTANEQAARLLANVSIKDYVKSRQKQLDADAGFTRQMILQELWSNHQEAKAAGQLNASNKALELVGKAIGVFVEKSESDVNLKMQGEVPVFRVAGKDIPLV